MHIRLWVIWWGWKEVSVEMAEELGVSRGSVREAMKILSALGIVEIKIGNGTYICDSPNGAMMDSLLFSLLISNPDISEFSEFRKLFEIDVVELIIQHFDKNETERKALADNLERLKQMQKEGAEINRLAENDIEFHRILGKASKNLVTEKIYNFIIDFMQKSIKTTHELSKQRGEIAAKSHQYIVEAIESRNIEVCRNAIEESVDTWSELQDAL